MVVIAKWRYQAGVQRRNHNEKGEISMIMCTCCAQHIILTSAHPIVYFLRLIQNTEFALAALHSWEVDVGSSDVDSVVEGTGSLHVCTFIYS